MAKADMQPLHSAFFNRPIAVILVCSQVYIQRMPDSEPVPISLPSAEEIRFTSPTRPITQKRQIHLQCMGKVVCIATSTVHIKSPECAHLVLQENYGIGQVFRRFAKAATFDILGVGVGPVGVGSSTVVPKTEDPATNDFGDQLWRKYRLAIPDFECEILEVFPSREMFACCEQWLLRAANNLVSGFWCLLRNLRTNEEFFSPP